MDFITGCKAAVAAFAAALTALWGWFGWFVLLWVFCMALDYITGTCAALRAGDWASKEARDGLWHKFGCIVAVLVAGLLDIAIGYLVERVGVAIPYTVFVCPLVVAWYMMTELGSIIENAGKLGAPMPAWLIKAIAALKGAVDSTASKLPGQDEEEKEE